MSLETLEQAGRTFSALRKEIAKTLVGQQELVEGLILALVCGQHVLLEGVPGVAKTLAVKTLGKVLGLGFQRIQFTPDLLPSDLVGTQIFHPGNGEFSIRKGPVFTNLVLADEINRSPAKVQSALLESMEERQVTLADSTMPLPRPFMVLATQNPIEQEGTYSLPEAQLDRFMFKINVGYPDRDQELEVLRLKRRSQAELVPILTSESLAVLSEQARQVHVDQRIEEFIVDLVRATREPETYKLPLGEVIRWGAGPRAAVFFMIASQARALWMGRDFVMPEDVRTLAPWILRHRILLTYEAMADGIGPDEVIRRILEGLPTP